MSKLKDIKRSPKHFWVKHLDPNREPDTETEALRFGKVLHKYILELGTFLEDYAIPPLAPIADGRTKEGKAIKDAYKLVYDEFAAANPDKEYTTAEEIAKPNIIDGVDQATGEVVEPESDADTTHTAEDWNIITDIINLVEEVKTKKRINKDQADSYDTAIASNFAGFDTGSLTATKTLLVKKLNQAK